VEVVSPQLTLRPNKGDTSTALDSIDFGSVLYGTNTTFEGILSNQCPLPIAYTVRLVEVEDVLGEETVLSNEKPFTITPMEGSIQPFQSIPVKFSFKPMLLLPTKGFESKFLLEKSAPKLSILQILFETIMSSSNRSTGTGIPLKLSGLALLPMFELTPSVLNFGDCPVNDRRDTLMTLTSGCDLDVPFTFTSTPFYKMNPSAGTLHPHQTITIVASFVPSQLGKFNKCVTLSVGKGIRNMEVKLFAEASSMGYSKTLVSGINKLPEDFKVNYKFVEPNGLVKRTKGSFKRAQPWEKDEFVSSLSWNEESVGAPDKYFDHDSNGPVTFSRQSLQHRAEHRQKYNDYITTSRTIRQHPMRVVEEETDFGLQMSKMSLPVAPDRLWLKNNGDDSNARTSSLTDENRLIAKKFPTIPQTQSEMKDCAVELSTEDYSLITPSHKVYAILTIVTAI
jgi:hypothetical protein